MLPPRARAKERLRGCLGVRKAARRIMKIASTVEPVQDGRIHIEKINGPFMFKDSPAEYGAGMKLALGRGWLIMHEWHLPSVHARMCRAVRLKARRVTVLLLRTTGAAPSFRPPISRCASMRNGTISPHLSLVGVGLMIACRHNSKSGPVRKGRAFHWFKGTRWMI
jgi:hypothetical protein